MWCQIFGVIICYCTHVRTCIQCITLIYFYSSFFLMCLLHLSHYSFMFWSVVMTINSSSRILYEHTVVLLPVLNLACVRLLFYHSMIELSFSHCFMLPSFSADKRSLKNYHSDKSHIWMKFLWVNLKDLAFYRMPHICHLSISSVAYM